MGGGRDDLFTASLFQALSPTRSAGASSQKGPFMPSCPTSEIPLYNAPYLVYTIIM